MTTTAAASPEPITQTLWQIEPAGFFSRHFTLYCDGELITTMKMSFWREGCTFSIAGHEFAIRRMSILKDTFQLLAGEVSVCDVSRNFWSRRFELSTNEQRWALQPAGFFSTSYFLLADGRKLGSIARVRWWSQRRIAEFVNDVPPPVQVLAIFLVLMTARRQSKAQ